MVTFSLFTVGFIIINGRIHRELFAFFPIFPQPCSCFNSHGDEAHISKFPLELINERIREKPPSINSTFTNDE